VRLSGARKKSITSMTIAFAISRWLLCVCVAALTLGVPLPVSAQDAALPIISLTAGRSTVLQTEFDVIRIAVTDPEVADALVVQPREILIDGRAPGTISLIIWGTTQRIQYDVVVEQTVLALQQQLALLFPGEEVMVTLNENAIVLSGDVSTTQLMLRMAEIARATDADRDVINLIKVPGAADAQQVMLQVRFAEVNRQAVRELGSSFFTGADGYRNWVARTTTQQFAAPDFDEDELAFSDFLNLFLFNTEYNMGAVLKALQQTGYFQSLAEPNLIAYNGQEASFLAGGEFPIPVVSGASGNVSVEYKEFGVRLTFTPTIAGDLIRLHVKPEVSSLDYNNGITLSGFRIPGLSTRRAETEVELRDGQSFAIAGLINNEAQNDEAAVPWLSRIPIIGNLFKSRADRQERTELLVLITPRLIRPLDPDEVPDLPAFPGLFLPEDSGTGKQLEGGGGTVDAPAIGGL
jgi:pilus assembly protein CpaC